MAVKKESVIEVLKSIKGPDSDQNIVDLGMVSDIFIADGKVYFSITVPASRAEELEPLRVAAQNVVTNLDGIQSAMVSLTAQRKAGDPSAAPRSAAPSNVSAKSSQNTGQSAGQKSNIDPISGVKHIVAIASGKGGVGKSTTSVNVALGLQRLGLKVGILDADIYGPSMPRLLGINGRPEQLDSKTLKPMERFGLKVMSIGFLVEEDTPMIWRGPMVMSALRQMMRDVAWADKDDPLDVLVVDMPPGTGDAQLSMAQQVPLAGAVIVSTPQDLALIDARKGLNMFKKVNVPLLGLVENMSYFICTNCGEHHDIFGHGGAKSEAEKLKIPFLGEVPLNMNIRATSDSGDPVVVSDPNSEFANIYIDIAKGLHAQIQERYGSEGVGADGPSIVFE